MKYYKSKTARFLNGKGFYFVMAVCMIAIGFAAYSAMDAARLDDKTPTHDFSDSSNEEIQNEITLEPVKPDMTEPVEEPTPTTDSETSSEQTTAVDNAAVAEYFFSPLENGSISKAFDGETLQYSATYNDMRLHTGTDIIPDESLLVNSCGNGTVASIDADTIMGTVITIDHGNGIYIRYCGVKNVKVAIGDVLTSDTAIAEVGTVTSECAEEAHLHIEVIKDGNPIDPATLIPLG